MVIARIVCALVGHKALYWFSTLGDARLACDFCLRCGKELR